MGAAAICGSLAQGKRRLMAIPVPRQRNPGGSFRTGTLALRGNRPGRRGAGRQGPLHRTIQNPGSSAGGHRAGNERVGKRLGPEKLIMDVPCRSKRQRGNCSLALAIWRPDSDASGRDICGAGFGIRLHAASSLLVPGEHASRTNDALSRHRDQICSVPQPGLSLTLQSALYCADPFLDYPNGAKRKSTTYPAVCCGQGG
jgi:hypothetical protein